MQKSSKSTCPSPVKLSPALDAAHPVSSRTHSMAMVIRVSIVLLVTASGGCFGGGETRNARIATEGAIIAWVGV